MITIYLLINVLLGSLVRDTLNLLGLLQTGWGWIELFSLIYKKADGLFYYILILNQVAVSFFISLVKLGDIFLDCLESGLWYEKVTRVKRLAMYGQNDSFRLGENYSVHFIILTVVLLYSVSCPLIHCFGFLYFYTKLYLDTYTITVFHEEESVSNMKLIERVIQSIAFMVSAWIFLTATSLTFSKNYSNSIILYIFFGLVIYYAFTLSKVASLKDPETDYIINNKNIESAIQEWRQAYRHPCGYYSQARPLGSSRISMESSVHNIGFVGS